MFSSAFSNLGGKAPSKEEMDLHCSGIMRKKYFTVGKPSSTYFRLAQHIFAMKVEQSLNRSSSFFPIQSTSSMVECASLYLGSIA